MEADFDEFVPLGTKAAKASFSADAKTIFKSYGGGVKSNRDEWVYDFQRDKLADDVRRFIDFYNGEIARWQASGKKTAIDDFVNYSDIKWSRDLKLDLKRGNKAVFDETKIRRAIYRPFCEKWLFFDSVLNEEIYIQPRYFPTPEAENRVIWVKVGSELPFFVLMTDCIPDLLPQGGSQCFPLYTFSADGSERFDNITGFALQTARAQWGEAVTREDIFYATYALLHAPDYRTKFAENLKRELPRLPLDDLPLDQAQWAQLVEVGRALGELHVGYESAPPYPLANRDTTPDGVPFSFRVEKMRWRDDKSRLIVNSSIELSGFNAAMFDYRLGHRSALDWVVESYRVKTDARSGLVSDPNRSDEPRFILDLIARVATVALETSKLVGQLPRLFAEKI